MALCAGCGFSLDGSGNFGLTGVTNQEWPYYAPGHTNPDGWYCDTGTDGVKRLWHQPWNLPWGVQAISRSSGTGVYANGIGPQQVCPLTFTFRAYRWYRLSGTFSYQCDVASIFDPTNIYFGARAGGLIWDDTAGNAIVGATYSSPVFGYANTITLTASIGDTYDFTRTISWRSYAVGLINCRPLAAYQTYLSIEDMGPRI